MPFTFDTSPLPPIDVIPAAEVPRVRQGYGLMADRLRALQVGEALRITLDRDPKNVADTWTSLARQLGLKVHALTQRPYVYLWLDGTDAGPTVEVIGGD